MVVAFVSATVLTTDYKNHLHPFHICVISNLDVIIELAEILGIMLILSLHLSLSFSLDFHRTDVDERQMRLP